MKPEFWADEDLADLPRDARLLYIGLWNLADEHSRLRGDPRFIKGQIFPYDDDLPPRLVDELVSLLAAAGKVQWYRVGGKQYLFLPNLGKHQRLEPAKVASKLPTLDEADPEEPPPAATVCPDSPASRADFLGQDPNEFAWGAEDHALLYGTGSMEHGSPTVPAAETAATAARPLSVTQRSKRITDAYYEINSMCKWPAINGIVMKAIQAQKYADEEINDAMQRLAKEGRTVSVETLRLELEGMPPSKANARASPRGTPGAGRSYDPNQTYSEEIPQ